MLCNKFCWTFKMIIVMLVTFLILSCLPLLQAVTNDKISTHDRCPESFSCPNLAPFTYPFYNNATNEGEGCRLIKVNCTSEGGEIQLGRQSYEIVEKVDSFSPVVIRNTTFEELVNSNSCEALMNTFTSPNPLLYSVFITPFIALFKCRNNLSYTDFYFDQPDYKSFNKCKDYNFYYKYSISNATVSSDLPHTCEEIKLPVKVKTSKKSKEVDETNIFSLLSSSFSISFEPPLICEECKRKEAARNLPWVKLLLALGVGVVIILISIIVCLKWKFGWRKKAEYNVNVENFLKNQAFMAPKRYSYSQIKKMTNTFKVKLGQGGFGSVYRGELSNGNLVAVKVLSQLKGDGKDFVNEVASVGRTLLDRKLDLVRAHIVEASRKS